MNKVQEKMSNVQVDEVLNLLSMTYPEAECELNFNTPFELLVAVMLSAQCTDKRVNMVTARLFVKYKTPEDFVQLGQSKLEEEIKECGLFRNKAKNILATCQTLIQQYQGEVPHDLAELVKLPGVGRKTANVVASNAFGIPAIGVDTHVFRVSNRIGLAKGKEVEQVEEQLMQSIPREKWIKAHHWLIWHGRRICEARRPKCEICPLKAYCQYYQAENCQ